MRHVFLVSLVCAFSWFALNDVVPENTGWFVELLVAIELTLAYLFLFLSSNSRFVNWYASTGWPSETDYPEKYCRVFLHIGAYLLAGSGIVALLASKILGAG